MSARGNFVAEFARECGALTWRNLAHTKRRPVIFFSGLVQPLLWLLLFGALFSGSARLSGGSVQGADYQGFFAVGLMVFAVAVGSLNAGVPVMFDRELGFLTRILVTPMRSPLSIIIAAVTNIGLIALAQATVIVVVSALMGAQFSGSISGILITLLFLTLLSLGIASISLMLSFKLRAHFELLALIQLVSLPLLLVSGAILPLEEMSRWFAIAAGLNPMTWVMEPLRIVLLGNGWSLSTTAVRFPLASLNILQALALTTLFAIAASVGSVMTINRVIRKGRSG